MIYGDDNAGRPTWYGLTCFTVLVVAMSFVFAWKRLKSGSLWTGAILDASHNLYYPGDFHAADAQHWQNRWYIDEFGCVLPAVAVACAIYFWTKRRELPAPA